MINPEIKTFEKSIKFLSKEFNVKSQQFENQVIEKIVTFKEIDQTDKGQHALFFLMRPLFVEQPQIGNESKLIADPAILLDLTKKAIDCLLIENENFNSQNKIEFMNDAMALLRFGEWFVEKFASFFFTLISSY